MTVIPVYILVLFLLILIDYFAAILIEKSDNPTSRKWYLIMSIVANIGLLGIFKYFNFFNINIHALANLIGWNYSLTLLQLALPIGLSFHTFQSMSYTIEVYKNNQKAERHLGIYAIYVMFFPQLVAGPIERAKNLLPQFYENHYFEYNRVTDGLKLMLWGFFKKVVIADRLAILVNAVYNDPLSYHGGPLILATIFFAFQIYCDFSGYSDIAIGSAQVMGFKLMDNFNRPYFSRSISEFWKRWHISLSTWFKDYLYIPLGGNRVSKPRMYLNLFIVFLVSGLWHGANWTFVIWGSLHGFYSIIGVATRNLKEKIYSKTKLSYFPKIKMVIQIVITFILVDIGWIFFRANSWKDGWYILTHLFSKFSSSFVGVELGLSKTELIIALVSIGLMEFVHLLQEHIRMRQFLSDKPRWIRWSIYLLLIWFILFFGVFTQTKFIYFQF